MKPISLAGLARTPDHVDLFRVGWTSWPPWFQMHLETRFSPVLTGEFQQGRCGVSSSSSSAPRRPCGLKSTVSAARAKTSHQAPTEPCLEYGSHLVKQLGSRRLRTGSERPGRTAKWVVFSCRSYRCPVFETRTAFPAARDLPALKATLGRSQEHD